MLKFSLTTLPAVATCVAIAAFLGPVQAAPRSPGLAAEHNVVRVHGFHCSPDWSGRWGYHRHWDACAREFPHFHRGHRHWQERRWRHSRHGHPHWR